MTSSSNPYCTPPGFDSPNGYNSTITWTLTSTSTNYQCQYVEGAPNPLPPPPPPGSGSGGIPGGGGGASAPETSSAGKFRINPAYEILAPKLVQTLRNLSTFVDNNPKILQALQKFSGRSEIQILNDVMYGKGPEIKIGQPVDAYKNPVMGQFNSLTPDVITLDGAFINQLEHTTSPAASDALFFYLAVTLLHEYVHYGDHASGVTFLGEAGTAFEQAVFGVVVSEDNAGQLLMQLTRKP